MESQSNKEEELLLPPLPRTVHATFTAYGSSIRLTALVILICSLFTSFSTSFQSVLSHWLFSCLFASFSSSDVIEFLAFIGLPSFTQSNANDKSAHFHVEANFEPLFSRLQADFRFLLYPMPSVPSLLLAKFLPK